MSSIGVFPCLALQWARRRQAVALGSQRARWEMHRKANAHFTVSESFTLGWLNVLLRHLWPTIIEKEASEVAAKNIKARSQCCAATRMSPENHHAATQSPKPVLGRECGLGRLMSGKTHCLVIKNS